MRPRRQHGLCAWLGCVDACPRRPLLPAAWCLLVLGQRHAPACAVRGDPRRGPAAAPLIVGPARRCAAVPCREHGETLSKLEKKAALTLQMNFQVGGRYRTAPCTVCTAAALSPGPGVPPQPGMLPAHPAVCYVPCAATHRAGRCHTNASSCPAPPPPLFWFLQYRRDEAEGERGGRGGGGGGGRSRGGGGGASGSSLPAEAPHPLAAVLGGDRRAVVIGGAASVPSQLQGRSQGGSRGNLQEALAASVESAQVESAVRASQAQPGAAAGGQQQGQGPSLSEADFPTVGGGGSGSAAAGGAPRWAGAAGGGAGGSLSADDFPALPGRPLFSGSYWFSIVF